MSDKGDRAHEWEFMEESDDLLSDPEFVAALDESDTVSDVSSPNVMAFSWVVPSGEVVWTLYRSTPGITEPRLAFENLTSGAMGDCGPVVVPDRFGSVGTTKAEFKAWVLRFIRSTGQEA